MGIKTIASLTYTNIYYNERAKYKLIATAGGITVPANTIKSIYILDATDFTTWKTNNNVNTIVSIWVENLFPEVWQTTAAIYNNALILQIQSFFGAQLSSKAKIYVLYI